MVIADKYVDIFDYRNRFRFNMEDLRKYWEVPTIAHFCSLFRSVFKLIDFDIEELEEALIADTEAATEGGRSSLIVDLLISLLRGCLGRKEEINLLNYNQALYDFLEIFWVAAGQGGNPLGTDRLKCCFHIVPLYAKVKVLHLLCEYRLDRPDVEGLTRNLTGDSLRIYSLGHDDNGATYWYFYGTRLYKEDPEPVKLKIALDRKKPKVQSSSKAPVSPRKKKRSKRGRYSKSKKSKQESEVSGDEKEHDPEEEGLSELNTSGLETSSQYSKQNPLDYLPNGGSERLREGRDSDIEALVSRIYAPADEDDEESSQRKGLSTPASVSLPPTQNTSRGQSPVDLGHKVQPEVDQGQIDIKDNKQSDENTQAAGMLDVLMNAGSTVADEKDSALTQNDSHSTDDKKPKEEPLETGGVTEQMYSTETQAILRRPHIPEGPKPWDQPGLKPPENCRWSLICENLDQWKALAAKFEKSTSNDEVEFRQILIDEFIPAIEQLFTQKEKDMQKKLLEMAPRRTSDRIEEKKLKREKEAKMLNEREFEELQKQARTESEKKQKQLREQRDLRIKEREKEREKRLETLEKAKEERGRRLELRKQRQELIGSGQEVPAELLAAYSSTVHEDDEALDLEIDREHTYGQLEKLLDAIRTHEDAWPFLEPVSEDIAPGYREVVKEPMDLSTIETKLLDERQYKSKLDFVKDINLMLCNCLVYNGVYSEYTKVAQRLERAFIKLWKKFFPPGDIEDYPEATRKEALDCIAVLGELGRRIKRELNPDASEESHDESYLELARRRKKVGANAYRKPKSGFRSPMLDMDSPSPEPYSRRRNIYTPGGADFTRFRNDYAFSRPSPQGPSRARLMQSSYGSSYQQLESVAFYQQSPRNVRNVSGIARRTNIIRQDPLPSSSYGLQAADASGNRVIVLSQRDLQQAGRTVSSQPRYDSSGTVVQQHTQQAVLGARSVTRVPVHHVEQPVAGCAAPSFVLSQNQPQRIVLANPRGGSQLAVDSVNKMQLVYIQQDQGTSRQTGGTTACSSVNVAASPSITNRLTSQLVRSSTPVSASVALSSAAVNTSTGSIPATTSSGGSTVIPLPNGKHFLMRSQDGTTYLLEKDPDSGHLRNVCRLSQQFQEQLGVNKLLSNTGTASPSGQAQRVPISVSVTPSGHARPGAVASNAASTNAIPTVGQAQASITDSSGNTSSLVRLQTPGSQSSQLQQSIGIPKPVCSVAPVRQQSMQQLQPVAVSSTQQTFTVVAASASGGCSQPKVVIPQGGFLVQQPLLLLNNQGGTPYVIAQSGQQNAQFLRVGGQQILVTGSSASHNVSGQVQVIQVVPQIVLNTDQSVMLQSPSHSAAITDNVPCSPQTTTTVVSSPPKDDLLSEAWKNA